METQKLIDKLDELEKKIDEISERLKDIEINVEITMCNVTSLM